VFARSKILMFERPKVLKTRQRDKQRDSHSDNYIVSMTLYCGLFRGQRKRAAMARPLQNLPVTTATTVVTVG